MTKTKLLFLRAKHFVRYHKVKLGGMGIGAVSLCLGEYVLYTIRNSLTIPTSVLDTEKSKEYIYIHSPQYKSHYRDNENNGGLSSLAREFIKETFPTPIAKLLFSLYHQTNLAEDYVSPWAVLRKAQSKNPDIRMQAVESIAAYKSWNEEERPHFKEAKLRMLQNWLKPAEIETFDMDAELRTLAQSIDPKTAVGLARTHDVDMRLFLPPPPLQPQKAEQVEDQLRDVLLKVPKTEADKCIRFYTSGALALSDEQKVLRQEARWVLESHGHHTRNVTPQEDVELLCLQAIAKHSVFEDHCKIMVECEILQTLQRLKDMRPDNLKIQENIVKIVSNICMFEQFHPQVHQSGWVSMLAVMCRSEYVALRIQASRGLANLDREAVKETFRDGVHVLYPRFRSRLKPEVDVVFVHGLMGGSFYSWRNSTLIPPKSSNKTQCWPESWLPQDLPGHRIMCVDYDTNLTEWMQLCPNDIETRSISYRSRQILDGLIKAGVGRRPIVWVTHSMGGLIAKQMLLDAKENPGRYGKVLDKTKGIIFFSTPHRGSELASHSNRMRGLAFPSTEVMELSRDSPKLAHLNDFLKKLTQDHHLSVLSFGETQSTKIGFGNMIKLQVVRPCSSNPGVGEFILADTNHLNVCKPTSRQSLLYQRTLKFIRSATKSPQKEPEFSPNEPDLLFIL